METAIMRSISKQEAILYSVFRKNIKILKSLSNREFEGLTMRGCISLLKEKNESNEEIMFQIIEELDKYHKLNYEAIIENINTYI